MVNRDVLRRVGATAAAAALLAVVGCSPDRPADDGTGPIRIGASLPLSGEFSQGGRDTQQGYEVWQALQNERGGLLGRPVEMIVRDDATNQNQVVTNYTSLISSEKVNLLLGTQSSLLNIPGSAIAEKNKMLYVCPSCASPKMFDRGYQYMFFSQQATADRQAQTFADWVAGLPESERPKTAAYPALDDPFAAPVVENVRQTLEAAGIRTVYADVYPTTTKNFDSIVNTLKDARADIVVHGSQYEDGINMVRAMNRANYQPGLLYQSSSPTFGQQYLDGVGEANTQGVLFSASYDVGLETPGNKEFRERYAQMFGGAPPEDAADGYAAGQVLAAAVQAVGNVDDQRALADWLRANEVATVLGPLSWNANGSPKGEFLVGQWQSGEPKVVLPREVATSQTIYRWRGQPIGGAR
ncbi:ABC transporter substrate-binding protein [Enemella evansiae]|nr:ABC transporter substrate-binding protein [Enemella evansiae]